MADTKAILSSDKSAAPAVALSLLCALIAVQMIIGVRGLWKDRDKAEGQVATHAVAAAPPVPVSPSSLPPLVIPPLPIFTNPMPSATVAQVSPTFAPPVQAAAGVPPARPLAGATAVLPGSGGVLAVMEAPPSQTPAAGAPSAARTGNAEADELLDVAAQSFELGDENGGIEALNRADLLLPNNPVIMRQKTLALQRQGVQEQQDQAPSASMPAPGGRGPQPLPGTVIPSRQGAPRPSGPPPSALNHSFGAKVSASPAPVAAPPEEPPTGPLSLGPCQIVRDPAVIRGERFSLKVPLIAAPGEIIDPNQMILDVMFYDKVNDQSIELTMADKPRSAYDTAGDFKSGREVISVLYNLPEFTPAQLSELGRHVFYGYVVKLYYKNRLVGAAANPPDLSMIANSGGSLGGAMNAPAQGGRN